MKKIAVFLALLVFLAGMLGTASAAGTLPMVQEIFVVLPAEKGYHGTVFAEVRNDGDADMQFDGGLYELFDKDGNSIGIRDLDYFDYNPEVLHPGETGYLFTTITIETAADESAIADYALTLHTAESITTAVTRYPAQAHFQAGTGKYKALRYAAAIVENDADDILRDFFAAFALKDYTGRLLYIASGTWSSSGVMGHSQMEIRLKVENNFLEYWEKKGIIPASVEAVVFTTLPSD